MTLIAVSTLNYNNAKETWRCVSSLLASVPDSQTLSIWVGDNASEKDDRRVLEKKLKNLRQVHLIQNEANLGFAGGHNGNIRLIFQKLTPDYVWIINNDCEVQAGAIAALIECSRLNPLVGLWGATLIEPDGKTVQCAGGCTYSNWISSYRQLANGKSLDSLHSLNCRNIDYVAGASMFLPARTLLDGLTEARYHPLESASGQRRWLNESFFLFFEELDLAGRLAPGLKLGWCREALIIHRNRKSGNGKRRPVTIGREYHSTLSALKFTWLYHRKKLWVTAPARFLAKLIVNSVSLRFDLTAANSKAYGDFWQWIKQGKHTAREFE